MPDELASVSLMIATPVAQIAISCTCCKA